ncbi:MAG: M42 family metallopeptidase [Anaerolineae bacterium]|nr:M42 family metallopeptidase [Anaerolineae bacterium]
MKETIKKLVEAWGPSGFEHHVRALIKAEVADLADEMRVDAVGNLICRMGSGGPRVMVAAHMDEIGVILTYQDPDGFFRFNPLGGVLPETLTGHRVLFENGAVGAIHREGAFRRSDGPGLDQFYIDVQDGEGDDAGVQVGDPGAFTRTFEERGSRLIAKSMDDRVGCAVAIGAMRKLKETGTPNEVYFVFTVQEEVGLRGARPAAFGLEPAVGIALDVTVAGDTPRSGVKLAVNLGEGAAIKVQDTGLVVPPAIKNWMIETARANGIPYQLELLSMGSTDAAGISLSRSGVPSGCISIPCRYVHTTSETVDLRDVEASVDLLAALLKDQIAL